MAHTHMPSVKAETRKASALLIFTMLGGLLVISSFVIEFGFISRLLFQQESATQYADIIALVGAIMLAAPLIGHALAHLGHGHMSELVALAIVAAIALGDYQEAGIIAFFMVLSNVIETRTALGARGAIEELLRITPDKAHRMLEDGTEEIVEAKDLRPDEIIRIRPGDNVPADGVVLNGVSSLNQANITGESLPVDKEVGSEVFSGTTNLTGSLEVKVTKAGKDTTLGRVQELILDAERSRTPLMRLIDQYAGWYTPTVVMLAGAVCYFSWLNGDNKEEGVQKAITMLIVACPCALVLATPTAMVAALSCAARLGILIKNVLQLEGARSLTAVIFDKTGTLTTGELSVTQMKPVSGVDGADLLQTAASAEQLSKHPAALATVAIARKAKIELSGAEGFQEAPGRGVSAKVNGDTVMVGRSSWLGESGVNMSIMNEPEFAEPEGVSLLYVARNNRCIGWIGLEDRTRAGAKEAIDALRGLNLRNLSMVTGDKWSVAKRVGAEMGCSEVLAEVLPEEKLQFVDDLRGRGHRVAVVGDGVNDAPMLAAADLGFAMGAAGSDVAIQSASIALLNNDLSRLPFTVKLSRATTRVVWQNILIGVIFIVVTMTLAIWGPLKPIGGAIAHTVVTAVVIFNSARLVRYGEDEETAAVPIPARGRPAQPLAAN